MTEKEKVQCIFKFLYKKTFKPLLHFAKENHDNKIKKLVNDTMNLFQSKKTARDAIQLYRDIINHKTLNSKANFIYLSQKGINTKLEDIEDEFNKTFNDTWLNS